MVACAVLRAYVPATSANLGPGFDALGLALDLMLEVRVTLAERDRFHYRGVGSLPDTPNNLVHEGFRAVFRELGMTPPSVAFAVDNPIPLARGLGSSSAALVAGAALADAMTGERLGREGVFRLTAAIEGHPDNVAPAVFGGLSVSAADEHGAFVGASLDLPSDWRLLFGVPDYELATTASRGVLPDSYSRADTVLTSSRAALWVAAVASNRPELLRTASLDVLHQPQRAHLIPGFTEASAALRQAGAYAVFLSGSGPTVGVVASEAAATRCKELLRDLARESGAVHDLRPATGYRLERC